MAKKNDTMKWVVILAGLGIGGYLLYNWISSKLSLPSVGGAVGQAAAGGVGYVAQSAADTGKAIAGGTYNIFQLPGNIATGNVPALAGNTVDILAGMKAIPLLGDLLNNPYVNAAMGGLSQTAKANVSPGANSASQIAQNANVAAIRKAIPVTITTNNSGAQVGTYAALNTNVVQGYTAPAQQIANYQVASKIVKVAGISRKVM